MVADGVIACGGLVVCQPATDDPYGEPWGILGCCIVPLTPLKMFRGWALNDRWIGAWILRRRRRCNATACALQPRLTTLCSVGRRPGQKQFFTQLRAREVWQMSTAVKSPQGLAWRTLSRPAALHRHAAVVVESTHGEFRALARQFRPRSQALHTRRGVFYF